MIRVVKLMARKISITLSKYTFWGSMKQCQIAAKTLRQMCVYLATGYRVEFQN